MRWFEKNKHTSEEVSTASRARACKRSNPRNPCSTQRENGAAGNNTTQSAIELMTEVVEKLMENR
jgi:hypothetical protein